MLSTGAVSMNDPEHPPNPAPFDQEWIPSVVPMRSAYLLHNGQEPDFTNKAMTKKSEIFEGTLDYIWLNKKWDVKSVLPLPSSADMNSTKSFPTAVEPSDHLMIGAKLKIKR